MTVSDKSVFLGMPYTRPDTRAFTISLLQFASASQLKNIAVQDKPFGLDVASARNYLVECFLLGDCDYIIFIDNDCEFTPLSIDRLVEHNVPVVCGGMYMHTVPPRPTIGMYMGVGKDGKAHYSFKEYSEAVVHYAYKNGVKSLAKNAYMFPDPELMEIDGCGMHFTLIRRDVIETMRKPYFLMQGKTGAGEDFYFCKKAQDAGFKLYTDLSVQTAHWAGEQHDFGLRELLHLNKIANTGEVDEIESMVVG